jgi:hypothetical protein
VCHHERNRNENESHSGFREWVGKVPERRGETARSVLRSVAKFVPRSNARRGARFAGSGANRVRQVRANCPVVAAPRTSEGARGTLNFGADREALAVRAGAE